MPSLIIPPAVRTWSRVTLVKPWMLAASEKAFFFLRLRFTIRVVHSGCNCKSSADSLRVLFSQVVIVMLEGAVLGGGFGLACISDVAIAIKDTLFGMPETGLGIPPAQIAPFVAKDLHCSSIEFHYAILRIMQLHAGCVRP